MKNKIVFTSGYFIWVHIGHIELFKNAKKLGDELVVILNNDEQQILKYGKIIVPMEERREVLKSIRQIGEVVVSKDKDRTVCESLIFYKALYALNPMNTEFIFAKGGDRFESEIPEKEICDILGIKIVDGLGAKIQSQSELFKKVK